MEFEAFKKEVDKNIESLFNKANNDEKRLLNRMINTINDLCKGKQELISYLKEHIEQCKISRQLLINHKMEKETLKYEIFIQTYQEILSKIEKR